MNRYWLLGAKNKKTSGCADLIKGSSYSEYGKYELYIKQYRKVPEDLALYLQKIMPKGMQFFDVVNDNTLWEDYQYSGLGVELYSERFRSFIDMYRTQKDFYEWIPVNICSTQECRQYFIPYFDYATDVLDVKNTIYLNNSVMKPCFDFEKIQNYTLFNYEFHENMLSQGLYVNDNIKKLLSKEKFSNITFESHSLCSINGVICN